MSFIVKSLLHGTTASIAVVTNQLFGTSNDTTRSISDDGGLFEPVLQSAELRVPVSNTDNSPTTTTTSTDVERVVSTATTATTTESSPLLPPLQSASASSSSSLTSMDYMRLERSSQILHLFFIHAVVYYSMAVFGFSYLVQQWSIIDSLYYATVLFCTIGFGDIEPNNFYAQLYTIVLACYGIAFLGILLGNVIDYCLEYQQIQTEHNRRTVGTLVLHQLQEHHNLPNNNDITNNGNKRSNNTRSQDTIIVDETVVPDTTSTITMPSLLDEILQLIVFEIPVLSFAIGIAIGIGHYEGWTVFESIYWFIISGATVGFGDYYPHLTWVKLVCVVYLPFAVAVLGDLLGRIVTIYMDRKRRSSEQKFLSRSLTMMDLDVMDVDHNGHVDKAEFIAYMLCALQKVTREDIADIIHLFHRLDVNHDNYLTKSDLIAKQFELSFQTSIRQFVPQPRLSSSSSSSSTGTILGS